MATTSSPRPKCLIVGGHGYLGSELARYLEERAGYKVWTTSRHPSAPSTFSYRLGDDLPTDALKGNDALIHCAYDFADSGWKEIHKRNVEGSVRLLDQAAAANIPHMVTISSMAAFPGCRSQYGRAKLLIEEATLARGGIVLRPGLIYGGRGDGMYGRLLTRARQGGLLPILAGSPCTQHLIRVEDLSRLIAAILTHEIARPTSPWSVAHPRSWSLRELLQALAGDRTLRFVPVPWQAAWFGLRVAEALGFQPAFKSDSVRSIVYSNPAPDFSGVLASGIPLRPFQPL